MVIMARKIVMFLRRRKTECVESFQKSEEGYTRIYFNLRGLDWEGLRVSLTEAHDGEKMVEFKGTKETP